MPERTEFEHLSTGQPDDLEAMKIRQSGGNEKHQAVRIKTAWVHERVWILKRCFKHLEEWCCCLFISPPSRNAGQLFKATLALTETVRPPIQAWP